MKNETVQRKDFWRSPAPYFLGIPVGYLLAFSILVKYRKFLIVKNVHSLFYRDQNSSLTSAARVQLCKKQSHNVQDTQYLHMIHDFRGGDSAVIRCAVVIMQIQSSLSATPSPWRASKVGGAGAAKSSLSPGAHTAIGITSQRAWIRDGATRSAHQHLNFGQRDGRYRRKDNASSSSCVGLWHAPTSTSLPFRFAVTHILMKSDSTLPHLSESGLARKETFAALVGFRLTKDKPRWQAS